MARRKEPLPLNSLDLDTLDLKKVFSKKLDEAMQSHRGLRGKDVAEAVYVSEPTFSSWKNGKLLPDAIQLLHLSAYFNKSIPWLLGIEQSIEENGGVRWIEYLSHITDKVYREQVVLGIDLFKETLNNEFEIVRHTERFKDYKPSQLIQAFTLAIRLGGLVVTDVVDDPTEAQSIKDFFYDKHGITLRKVIISSTSGSLPAIGAELVAYLAAKKALIDVGGIVGIGSGYTLFRMAELSPLPLKPPTSTVWFPLVSYPEQNLATHAANYICSVLSSRYESLETFFLPFVPENQNPPEKLSQYSAGAETAFFTVKEFNVDTITSDEKSYKLKTVAGEIKKQRLGDEVIGEMLGIYINDKAQPLSNPIIREMNRNEAFQVDLDVLRSISTRGDSWLVAAGRRKAPMVRVAILNKLANCLVIDRELANSLRS